MISKRDLFRFRISYKIYEAVSTLVGKVVLGMQNTAEIIDGHHKHLRDTLFEVSVE